MKTENSWKHLTPVVYTMGKVASSSVSRAVLDAGLPCHDIHSLVPEYLRRTAIQWLEKGAYPPPHICTSMAHRDRLLIKRRSCVYISLVRDPISRNLSAFFQNLHLQNDELKNEINPLRLFEKFVKDYHHSIPLTWFDREFEGQIGIDVYETPFDHENRYVYIKSKNTVLFRTDCPDETKSAVLSRVLGREIIIRRQNDGAKKNYAERYHLVKKCAWFSEEFVDKIYESRFAKHFWGESELKNMKAAWIGEV